MLLRSRAMEYRKTLERQRDRERGFRRRRKNRKGLRMKRHLVH